MSGPASGRMSADEFLRWAMEQPQGKRYELVGGEVVAMSPERSSHALVKGNVFVVLRAAIAGSGLPCTAYPDGLSVRVDATHVYEPDALVRCGPALPDDAIFVPDPMILVEVVSPSSSSADAGAKLDGYLGLPSVRHYLLVKTENGTVIHHRKDEGGAIQTTILKRGALELKPPGLAVEIASFFA